MKLLHFADAHIDMANYGSMIPRPGCHCACLIFSKHWIRSVDAAISEKVDMVIFAGDAYKDRSPAPTFQREWGKRIIRLSQAKIPTLLLVGNHDLSPATGRAHAIQEFDTLEVPYVRVLQKPQFYKPVDLWDLPVQVIAMPWVSRSGLDGVHRGERNRYEENCSQRSRPASLSSWKNGSMKQIKAFRSFSRHMPLWKALCSAPNGW